MYGSYPLNIGIFSLGDVKPVIDSVFSFEDTLSAFDRIMTHRARGKVVVRVDSDAE